jgi:hypothetical protein
LKRHALSQVAEKTPKIVIPGRGAGKFTQPA